MAPKRKRSKSSSASASNTATTVHLNVGGTKYEVSRSMVERYPDTMLARLISETWQEQSVNDPSSPIFIERDGQRFRYVLDYMRDGQVSLSGQGDVTKESLLHELTYFGFANVDPSAITKEFTYLEAPKHMSTVTAEYQKELQVLHEELESAKCAVACATVAHACCIRYMSTGNLTIEFKIVERTKPAKRTTSNHLDFEVIDATKKCSLQHGKEADLNKRLEKYGLCMSTYSEGGRVYTEYGNRLSAATVSVTLQKL